jgi:hypothetical protein
MDFSQFLRKIKDLLKDPVNLSLLTACLYLATYLEQAAYLHYFGIDNISVRITPETLVIFSALVMFAVLFVVPLLYVMKTTISNSDDGPARWWAVLLLDAVFMVEFYGLLIQVALKTELLSVKGFWVVPLGILVLRTVASAFSKDSRADNRRWKDRYLVRRGKNIKYDVVLLGVCSMLLFAVSMGQATAADKTQYRYIDDYAVVDEYADKILLAQTTASGYLTGRYKYLSNTDNLVFTRRDIHIKASKKPTPLEKIKNIQKEVF